MTARTSRDADWSEEADDARSQLVGLARVEAQANANLKMVALSSNRWGVRVERAQSLQHYLLIMKQARSMALSARSSGDSEEDVLYRMRATQKSLIDGGLDGLTESEARGLCERFSSAGFGCQPIPAS